MSEVKEENEKKNINSLLLWVGVNSTSILVICAILTKFLYNYIFVVMARASGIPSVLFYYDVSGDFSSVSWSRGLVIQLFLSSPLLVFTLSLIALYFYRISKHLVIPIQFFMLWLFIASMNLVITNIVTSFFTKTGVAFVFDWIYLPKMAYIPLIIACFVTTSGIGHLLNTPFIKLSPSKQIHANKRPRLFLVSIVLLPMVAYIAIDMLLCWQVIGLKDYIYYGLLSVIGLSMFFSVKPDRNMKFIKGIKTGHKLHFVWVLAVVVLLLARLLITSGISMS